MHGTVRKKFENITQTQPQLGFYKILVIWTLKEGKIKGYKLHGWFLLDRW